MMGTHHSEAAGWFTGTASVVSHFGEGGLISGLFVLRYRLQRCMLTEVVRTYSMRCSGNGVSSHRGASSWFNGGTVWMGGVLWKMTSRHDFTEPRWPLGPGIHKRYPFASLAYPRKRTVSPRGWNLDRLFERI